MVGKQEIANQLIEDYCLQSELFDCRQCLLHILEGTKVPGELARIFKISDSRCVTELKRLFYGIKEDKTQWKTFLYSLTSYKECIKCKTIKPIESFNNYKETKYTYCTMCERASDKLRREANPDQYKADLRKRYENNPGIWKYNASKRRALLKQAIPSWADLEKIKEIYNNCPKGYEVDHIHPLQGENVCGLHVENNLQYLTMKENRSKYNKFSS